MRCLELETWFEHAGHRLYAFSGTEFALLRAQLSGPLLGAGGVTPVTTFKKDTKEAFKRMVDQWDRTDLLATKAEVVSGLLLGMLTRGRLLADNFEQSFLQDDLSALPLFLHSVRC